MISNRLFKAHQMRTGIIALQAAATPNFYGTPMRFFTKEVEAAEPLD